MILVLAFFGGIALVELIWFVGILLRQRDYDAGYLQASIDQAEETVREMERASDGPVLLFNHLAAQRDAGRRRTQ